MTESFLLYAPRSGGPGDGPVVIQLGFAAEPIINLADSTAATLYGECLARLRVGNATVLKPLAFVAGLEARGDISLLDTAMVGIALDALASAPDLSLGCNVSPKTLADANAWRAVLDRIAQRGSLAARLTLEITETCPLNEIPCAAQRLMDAKRLGCRLAIDDFGAGFATAAHLTGVDVEWDIVKLDRQCIGDLSKKPSGRHGLRSFVSLAACLAPVVVVEGIETNEHLLVARAAGAQYGQGWLFKGSTPERWTALDVTTAESLRASLAKSQALSQPSFFPETVDDDESLLLSRVHRLGDHVRTFVSRAWAGGAR